MINNTVLTYALVILFLYTCYYTYERDYSMFLYLMVLLLSVVYVYNTINMQIANIERRIITGVNKLSESVNDLNIPSNVLGM